MRGFDDKFIDQLKSKCDIVDTVSRYVKLTQKGSNFWGVCPFHHEKTPSFAVNPQGQFFHCFGCHKSGDVITFVAEIEALDFADTVKLLAERAGLQLPEITYDDEKTRKQKKLKERIFELLRDTALFYVKNLKSDKAQNHIDYLVKRKIPFEYVAKFGMGASLNFASLPEYLKSLGYTYEEMVASGVVDVKNGRYFDALGGRLIIPIINQFNQVVAFGGRNLEKTDFAKYKNTCETIVFSKKNNLYNLNNLKKLKNEQGLNGIIIVEGYMDTISLVANGFNNVVASMGTSLTKDQARILKRYSNKVYISYDGDFAGQKASIRGLEILSQEGIDVKVVSLPDGLDPDDVIKKLGKEAYQRLLDNAMPLIDFKLEIIKKTFDITTVDGKRKYVTNAVNVIRESASPAEQEDLLATVREISGNSLDALKRELYSKTPQTSPKTQVEEIVYTETNDDKTAIAGRFILCSYLFNKNYALEQDIGEIEFTLDIHKRIAEYVKYKLRDNQRLNFSNLYEEFTEEDYPELSLICELESSKSSELNESAYFSDCVKTLNLNAITQMINSLSKQFNQESDKEKRTEIAKLIKDLLDKKVRLTK